MKGSTGTAAPLDNATYTANTVFKSGSQIGTSEWYCVYNGTGSTVTITGLDGGIYQAMVCEYVGISGLEQYLTTTAPNNPVGINTEIIKSPQTITFDSIPPKTFGDEDFTPIATASSGLQVTYSVDSARIASVVNGKIHITGGGTCHVIASQIGDANYDGASSVSRTLVVNKASQSITFDALPAKLPGSAYCFSGYFYFGPACILYKLEPFGCNYSSRYIDHW